MHHLRPPPHQRSAIRIAAALLFLAMATGLFVGGAKPVAVDLFPWPWGKLVHALTFGVLTMTVGIASGKQGLSMLAMGFVSSVAVGALDEWHQTYLPGRHGQMSDVGFDAIGAALGVIFLAWIQFQFAHKQARE